jgi:hypothetical protein
VSDATFWSAGNFAGPTTPTGTVDLSRTGSGTLGASQCTLSGGSCQVTYTPSSVGTGTHTVTADYDGDTDHETASLGASSAWAADGMPSTPSTAARAAAHRASGA